jgi:hypothetical protein
MSSLGSEQVDRDATVRVCDVCGHARLSHDAIASRFCRASRDRALDRDCACAIRGSTADAEKGHADSTVQRPQGAHVRARSIQSNVRSSGRTRRDFVGHRDRRRGSRVDPDHTPSPVCREPVMLLAAATRARDVTPAAPGPGAENGACWTWVQLPSHGSGSRGGPRGVWSPRATPLPMGRQRTPRPRVTSRFARSIAFSPTRAPRSG